MSIVIWERFMIFQRYMKFFVDNSLLDIYWNFLKNFFMQMEYLYMKEEKSFLLNFVFLVLSVLLLFILVIYLC